MRGDLASAEVLKALAVRVDELCRHQLGEEGLPETADKMGVKMLEYFKLNPAEAVGTSLTSNLTAKGEKVLAEVEEELRLPAVTDPLPVSVALVGPAIAVASFQMGLDKRATETLRILAGGETEADEQVRLWRRGFKVVGPRDHKVIMGILREAVTEDQKEFNRFLVPQALGWTEEEKAQDEEEDRKADQEIGGQATAPTYYSRRYAKRSDRRAKHYTALGEKVKATRLETARRKKAVGRAEQAEAKAARASRGASRRRRWKKGRAEAKAKERSAEAVAALVGAQRAQEQAEAAHGRHRHLEVGSSAADRQRMTSTIVAGALGAAAGLAPVVVDAVAGGSGGRGEAGPGWISTGIAAGAGAIAGAAMGLRQEPTKCVNDRRCAPEWDWLTREKRGEPGVYEDAPLVQWDPKWARGGRTPGSGGGGGPAGTPGSGGGAAAAAAAAAGAGAEAAAMPLPTEQQAARALDTLDPRGAVVDQQMLSTGHISRMRALEPLAHFGAGAPILLMPLQLTEGCEDSQMRYNDDCTRCGRPDHPRRRPAVPPARLGAAGDGTMGGVSLAGMESRVNLLTREAGRKGDEGKAARKLLEFMRSPSLCFLGDQQVVELLFWKQVYGIAQGAMLWVSVAANYETVLNLMTEGIAPREPFAEQRFAERAMRVLGTTAEAEVKADIALRRAQEAKADTAEEPHRKACGGSAKECVKKRLDGSKAVSAAVMCHDLSKEKGEVLEAVAVAATAASCPGGTFPLHTHMTAETARKIRGGTMKFVKKEGETDEDVRRREETVVGALNEHPAAGICQHRQAVRQGGRDVIRPGAVWGETRVNPLNKPEAEAVNRGSRAGRLVTGVGAGVKGLAEGAVAYPFGDTEEQDVVLRGAEHAEAADANCKKQKEDEEAYLMRANMAAPMNAVVKFALTESEAGTLPTPLAVVQRFNLIGIHLTTAQKDAEMRRLGDEVAPRLAAAISRDRWEVASEALSGAKVGMTLASMAGYPQFAPAIGAISGISTGLYGLWRVDGFFGEEARKLQLLGEALRDDEAATAVLALQRPKRMYLAQKAAARRRMHVACLADSSTLPRRRCRGITWMRSDMSASSRMPRGRSSSASSTVFKKDLAAS